MHAAAERKAREMEWSFEKHPSLSGRRWTAGIFCGIEMVELQPTSPPKPQHHNNGAQQRTLAQMCEPARPLWTARSATYWKIIKHHTDCHPAAAEDDALVHSAPHQRVPFDALDPHIQ